MATSKLKTEIPTDTYISVKINTLTQKNDETTEKAVISLGYLSKINKDKLSTSQVLQEENLEENLDLSNLINESRNGPAIKAELKKRAELFKKNLEKTSALVVDAKTVESTKTNLENRIQKLNNSLQKMNSLNESLTKIEDTLSDLLKNKDTLKSILENESIKPNVERPISKFLNAIADSNVKNNNKSIFLKDDLQNLKNLKSEFENTSKIFEESKQNVIKTFSNLAQFNEILTKLYKDYLDFGSLNGFAGTKVEVKGDVIEKNFKPLILEFAKRLPKRTTITTLEFQMYPLIGLVQKDNSYEYQQQANVLTFKIPLNIKGSSEKPYYLANGNLSMKLICSPNGVITKVIKIPFPAMQQDKSLFGETLPETVVNNSTKETTSFAILMAENIVVNNITFIPVALIEKRLEEVLFMQSYAFMTEKEESPLIKKDKEDEISSETKKIQKSKEKEVDNAE